MSISNIAILEFDIAGTGRRIELGGFRAFVAGYTGRDPHAVQHHIDELAAIGVAPPPQVPMFYEMPAELFDSSGDHQRTGDTLTSGEIEPLYVRYAGDYYLGVGSDHTDRELETIDIGDSKRACPKPVGGKLVPVTTLEGFSLDDALAESWVDGRLYQRGTLDGIRTAEEVCGILIDRLDIGDEDFVCLGGTLPLLDGKFTDGRVWKVALQLGDGTRLEHTYKMKGQGQQ